MLYKRFATGSIELKADTASRMVEGYASVFNVLDHDQDIITPGAFAGSLERRGEKVKLLWQHNPGQPIGKPTKMVEDGHGLAVAAKVSETELGNEALTLAADGVVDSFSIGYNVLRKETLERSATMESVLGALGGSESSLSSDLSKLAELMAKIASAPWNVRVLKEIELFEFSLVTFPANEAAVVTGVKSARSKFRALEERIGAKAAADLRELLELVGAPVYLFDADPDNRGNEKGGAPSEGKAGRVLSKSNFDKLTDAHKAIGAVLEAATPKSDDAEDGDEGADPKSGADTDELEAKSVLSLVRDIFNPRNLTGSAGE